METRSARRKNLRITAEDEAPRYSGEDRISNLPDDVLNHILLLLPTKHKARMSVLSKRWRSLWSSFPDLDFSKTLRSVCYNRTKKRDRYEDENMLDFISHILDSRDKRSDIRVLRFSADLSFTRLNRLIRQAVMHNVQELDVQVVTKDYFNLPRSVIRSKSLRVLKVRSNFPGFRLPPSSIINDGFQILHTLSLSLIVFDDKSHLLDFFTESSFPRLKRLELSSCCGLESLRIACGGLEDLTLDMCGKLKYLSIFCDKLERLRVKNCFDPDWNDGWAKIDAPLLKAFVWKNNAIIEYKVLRELTSLKDASLGFKLADYKDLNESMDVRMTNLLAGISHAHCVTLDSLCFKIVSVGISSTKLSLPQFNNMNTLVLKSHLNDSYISILANLLRSSPSLNTLIINSNKKYSAQEILGWGMEVWDWFFSYGPNHGLKFQGSSTFMHHLKVVKIIGYSESSNTFILAKNLLEHGIDLQEMTICPRASSTARESLRREKTIKSQLIGVPWASSHVKLEITKPSKELSLDQFA